MLVTVTVEKTFTDGSLAGLTIVDTIERCQEGEFSVNQTFTRKRWACGPGFKARVLSIAPWRPREPFNT